ncbi:MAG: PAS domain-containing protein [Candidatus Thorarchaeota archaeon]
MRDSESNYRAIAENSLQGITVIHDDRYVYVNQAFANIVDFSVAEIMRMSPENQWKLVHQEDRPFLLNLAQDRHLGKPVPETYEYRFVTRDGSVRWVQAFSSKIQYDGEDSLQVFLIDITERRKVEDALRESEGKYRALAEQSIQALAILQDMGVVYANPAYSKLVGIPLDDVLKLDRKGIWGLLHPDDTDRLRGRFEQYSEDKDLTPRTTYRVVRPDGEIRWVESYVTIIEFSGNPAMQMALIDITDKMLAEEIMRASQEMLGLVMNSIPTFIYWKDTNSAYLGCNENFAKAAGVETPEDIIGKNDHELSWQGEDAATFKELDREVMESGSPHFNRVEPQIQADGREAWLEINRIPLRDGEGNIIGMLGTYEDITERVVQEESVRKSEVKYRNLAEQSLQGITILSDNGFEYVNTPFAEMVGWSVEELLAMNMDEVWNLFYPADQEILRGRIDSRSSGSSVPPRYEYRLVRSDGEIRWVEAYASRIEFNNQPALQTILIDTTERRKTEREVRAAKDRAMLYLDLLGHDVRNQLQVILNSAALMRNAAEDSTRDSMLRVVEDSVARCSRLIEEVKST